MKKLLGFLALVFIGGGFGFAIVYAGEIDLQVRLRACVVFVALIATGMLCWHRHDKYFPAAVEETTGEEAVVAAADVKTEETISISAMLTDLTMILCGAFGACGQIAWAHGDPNRIGENGLWLGLAFILIIRPIIVRVEQKRRKMRRNKQAGVPLYSRMPEG